MLSTKIRTAAAGLAAICAIALAAAGPAAAETKWGHLGVGQQGNTRFSSTWCGDMQRVYDSHVSAMKADIAARNYAASFKEVSDAAVGRGQAHDAGCAWAWT